MVHYSSTTVISSTNAMVCVCPLCAETANNPHGCCAFLRTIKLNILQRKACNEHHC